MTWIETCAAAWHRYGERRQERARIRDSNRRLDEKYEPDFFFEQRGVQDTGSVVATPEDLAEIGPFDPVTRIPRQGRGRHRKGAS